MDLQNQIRKFYFGEQASVGEKTTNPGYEDIPGSVSEEDVDAVGEEMVNPVEEKAVNQFDEETANPVNYNSANPVGQVRVQGEVQCPKRKNLDH
ncbi:hypothetical protein DAKH74_048450 [Maudiozyma humilis]|uniref:Uncharacterized protein n=1 Tax=Maudiozyma humilis TaxID=51915 RepID=A0AAV5S308_MAUHU|nr:hypothetical protein DAKH74_048450 [Kazachstania humilis]